MVQFTQLSCHQNFQAHLIISTGDRVAIEPHGICRTCDLCKEGRYNLCPNVFFLATPPDSGALARYHVHGADFVFKYVYFMYFIDLYIKETNGQIS